MNTHIFYHYLNERKSNLIGYKYYVNSLEKYSTIKEKLSKIIYNLSDTKINKYPTCFEVGPKPNFKTAWCTNVLKILESSNIMCISSIERTHLYHKLVEYDIMSECVYDKDTLKFVKKREEPFYISKNNINQFNKTFSLGFDDKDIKLYSHIFYDELKRNPTNVELFDLSQSNSEHCRHWLFRGKLRLDGNILPHSLMDLIKEPLKNNKNNSLIAFSDNASAIRGYKIRTLCPERNLFSSKFIEKDIVMNFTLKAETHNFPTAICPFPAAATGVGGRIRDNLCVGRGGLNIAGTAGYCVGNLNLDNYNLEWEDGEFKEGFILPADKILIEASNGASDYGNKIGEPIILGFARSFGQNINQERIEWIKPIMFTGGIGFIYDEHLRKNIPKKGMKIVRIGGAAYRIGLGGSSASSNLQSIKNLSIYQDAVQRGDAEMENKVSRVVRACVDLLGVNPIVSIHDQGAGGMANVTKEIIEPCGADINLDNVTLGDTSLSTLETWCAEYQEQITILVEEKNLGYIENLCIREKVGFSCVGTITDNSRVRVRDSKNKDIKVPIDLDIDRVLGNIPQKEFKMKTETINLNKFDYSNINFSTALEKVLKLLSVGSKRFLTNKVDRSVTGLIAQQQCIGPFHTPLSNFALVAQSHMDIKGVASSIGEQPIKGLLNPAIMARMVVGECLTNLMWVKITQFTDIKLSGNWMWPAKIEEENYHLYCAVKSLSNLLGKLKIGIDGGKDSVSMYVSIDNKRIKSPRTLVLSSYAPCPNIYKKVTPNFKHSKTNIVYVDLGYGKNRFGGSSICQVYNQIGSESPDFENPLNFVEVFNIIQEYIQNGKILSGHDRSDGGLITTLLEMSISSGIGFNISFEGNPTDYLLNEELGLVIEIEDEYVSDLITELSKYVPTYKIGKTTAKSRININCNGEQLIYNSVKYYQELWEKTSFVLEVKQIGESLARSEIVSLLNMTDVSYNSSSPIVQRLINHHIPDISFKIAILREEGSNGEREMASAFHMAGFETWDVTTQDLLNNENLLSNFRGIAFVGGFSYSDCLGSSIGWYNVIVNNLKIRKQFNDFYNRSDTFSFGVCNGCQLMTLLGYVGDKEFKLKQNLSKRFESRFSTIKISKSHAIMLKGMEDLIMGVWVAHGEGRFDKEFNDAYTPIKYVNNKSLVTETYPENPNGSLNGVAAICSKNGRHLAMMPHPERTFLKWQLPWSPQYFEKSLVNTNYSPWFVLFQNAYEWCLHNTLRKN
ncbi:uncharacterized protein METZ01_LOCUS66489 [marine metagenome]|uniref:phosphoribosylformylglycinamidine synthase n=1 Tax=marine metagenome TaxID=408172 RepID=A0A381TBU9_9ZZZZ